MELGRHRFFTFISSSIGRVRLVKSSVTKSARTTVIHRGVIWFAVQTQRRQVLLVLVLLFCGFDCRGFRCLGRERKLALFIEQMLLKFLVPLHYFAAAEAD